MKRLLSILFAALFICTATGLVAQTPVSDTMSDQVICRPFNLISADAGMTLVECRSDAGVTLKYRAVFAEVDTDAGVYFCQKTGATSANFSVVCHKRCKGCSKGEAYSADQTQGTLKCVSPTADAGTPLVVSCGR